jgi:hypothetical protein
MINREDPIFRDKRLCIKFIARIEETSSPCQLRQLLNETKDKDFLTKSQIRNAILKRCRHLIDRGYIVNDISEEYE